MVGVEESGPVRLEVVYITPSFVATSDMVDLGPPPTLRGLALGGVPAIGTSETFTVEKQLLV